MADDKQVQELLAALDSADIQTQVQAIRQLAELQAVQAVPRLIELLKSEQHEVRLASIAALGKMGDGRAIPILIEIAAQDLKADIQRESQSGQPPRTNSYWGPQSLRNKLAEIMAAQAAIETIKNRKVDLEQITFAEPPAEESEAEKQDALDEFYTRPMQPAELEESAPEPEPFAPPAPVPAGPMLDDPDEFDDEEHTGSMEPLDWDEASAAEAPPEPKPVPMPRPIPAPAPAVSLPSAPPPPQPAAPDRHVSRQRQETETGSPGGEAPKKVKEVQDVQFSAYYPREVQPDDWQPLQAYVFRQFAAERVLEDAEKQLGPLGHFRRIVENARQRIVEGETITATPHLPGFQFNPPAVSVGFFEDWHRFEFKMRAREAPLNLAANGFLTFTAGGIIVADIPLSVFVTNALTQAKPQASETRPMYDTVFASYSHRDTTIVERVEAAARTFGMTYLRDVITLRSGEDWNAGLQTMIEQATIFQMFWSEPYSKSLHCQREWEYAVNLKREGLPFIRPVYWQQPMPAPPEPLQHFHFAYQPDLVKL